jgi:hypothetical protein
VGVLYDLEAADLPLTVDVTPRRCQAFRLAPGQTCAAANLDAGGQEIRAQRLTADGFGLVTFPQFRLTQREGQRLVLSR